MQWRRGPTVKAQRTPGGQEREHRVQLVFRGARVCSGHRHEEGFVGEVAGSG